VVGLGFLFSAGGKTADLHGARDGAHAHHASQRAGAEKLLDGGNGVIARASAAPGGGIGFEPRNVSGVEPIPEGLARGKRRQEIRDRVLKQLVKRGEPG
jgi:hypothetical protein